MPAPPPGARVRAAFGRGLLLRTLPWAPVILALAYGADAFGLGAFFVPGQVAGFAAASAAEAALAARWQRRHGRRLLTGIDGARDVRHYAA